MSSSSDEAACDNYGGAWPYEMGLPWYPSIGQPLVYYSQVEPFCRRQRGIEKDKPNFFKKAFRWYTQEHAPFKEGRTNSSSNLNNADLKGFAAWLDEKYNEFLQSNQIERTKYILTQTSAVGLDKTNNSIQFEQPVSKKYKKVRRPWKKRRKYLNTKEKGDVIMKSNHSIEIILKPKELSCPASECCQRTKAQSCCNRSSCTVESNASTLHKVTQQNSHSLTSIEMHMIPFNIPNYLPKNYEQEHAKASNLKISKRVSNFKNKKYRSRNICQCSKYMDKKVDAFSQIEDKVIINKLVPCSCKSNNTEVKASLDKRNDKMELVDAKTKLNTATENALQKEETAFIANYTSTENNRAALLAPVSDSVQTSNYSINLSQDVYPEYPLFLKIVCADKLKQN